MQTLEQRSAIDAVAIHRRPFPRGYYATARDWRTMRITEAAVSGADKLQAFPTTMDEECSVRGCSAAYFECLRELPHA